MKIVNLVLMIISGISLIIGALFGLDIVKGAWLGVSGTGFLYLSMASSLYAIGLRMIKPFGGGGGESEG